MKQEAARETVSSPSPELKTSASIVRSSPPPGDVITNVAQNPDAIGCASLASVDDDVKALTVDGVEANADTVKDGSYQVQRPFVLVTKADTELSEVAQAFFDYVTSADAVDIITNGRRSSRERVIIKQQNNGGGPTGTPPFA